MVRYVTAAGAMDMAAREPVSAMSSDKDMPGLEL
jgi:hypothetical protein